MDRDMSNRTYYIAPSGAPVTFGDVLNWIFKDLCFYNGRRDDYGYLAILKTEKEARKATLAAGPHVPRVGLGLDCGMTRGERGDRHFSVYFNGEEIGLWAKTSQGWKFERC